MIQDFYPHTGVKINKGGICVANFMLSANGVNRGIIKPKTQYNDR